MNSNIEYLLHRDHINLILDFDLNAFITSRQQNDAEKLRFYDQRTACVEAINNIRVSINNIEIFQETLNSLLQKNEISEAEMSGILSYLSSVISNKKALTEAFDPENKFFKIKMRRLQLPDLNRKSVWDAMVKTSLEIERREEELTLLSFGNDSNKYEEYYNLKKEENYCAAQLKNIEKQEDEANKTLSKTFRAENISRPEGLKTLCEQINKNNIEILVIGSGDSDVDLAPVIQRRAKKALASGNELIIMSFGAFNKIINTGQPVSGVNKLSFLHHGVREFGYVSEVNKYITQMPNLKEIVIRGCGTAKIPKDNPDVVYEVKVSNVPYDQKPSIQGTKSLVVQQKEDHGKVLTKVSWVSNKSVVNVIQAIASVSKMDGKKPDEQQLQELERVEGMPLLKHGSEYIKSMRNIFFDKTKEVSADVNTQAKRTLRRARTEPAATSEEDLLSQVLNNMTAEQKKTVSVKAYIGGYEVRQGRLIPFGAHDQDRAPKALRVGVKADRSGSSHAQPSSTAKIGLLLNSDLTIREEKPSEMSETTKTETPVLPNQSLSQDAQDIEGDEEKPNPSPYK